MKTCPSPSQLFIRRNCDDIYLSVVRDRNFIERNGNEENGTKRKSEPFLISRENLVIPFRFSRSSSSTVFTSHRYNHGSKTSATTTSVAQSFRGERKFLRARRILDRFVSFFFLSSFFRTEPKKRRFHPLRGLRKIFRRKSRGAADVRLVTNAEREADLGRVPREEITDRHPAGRPEEARSRSASELLTDSCDRER